MDRAERNGKGNGCSDLRGEADVRVRIDDRGRRWLKVYFGSGSHFRNWLAQCREIYGEENIEVQEIENTGLTCMDEGGEKIYRIWARMRDGE